MNFWELAYFPWVVGFLIVIGAAIGALAANQRWPSRGISKEWDDKNKQAATEKPVSKTSAEKAAFLGIIRPPETFLEMLLAAVVTMAFIGLMGFATYWALSQVPQQYMTWVGLGSLIYQWWSLPLTIVLVMLAGLAYKNKQMFFMAMGLAGIGFVLLTWGWVDVVNKEVARNPSGNVSCRYYSLAETRLCMLKESAWTIPLGTETDHVLQAGEVTYCVDTPKGRDDYESRHNEEYRWYRSKPGEGDVPMLYQAFYTVDLVNRYQGICPHLTLPT